ncbi:hypothetical protein COT42_04105 [Candidatus Saganbacteria bacterium CG08_land_8_20_14_0_20_45_16]|uniref:Uncharacterized protein n=1 Tax=Candidatus Saganbacteria bacterium CG08_land_8_20_14_0_20_45_16 TaxID=2014293 RepID=A0A2H0Y0F1_UNCSA|nr:MAG: hypothetical protein COT42_04105 [Candidatus Saganbacteria bacterium CG08_land_8_20_14_0_20_45_16]
MPQYPVHPCCYCPVLEAGSACANNKKVECIKFLAYLQRLSSMKAQKIIIQELRYLVSNKGGK